MTTWTKLRDGSWGVSGPSDAIRAGAVVTVTKKDGSTSSVTVASVLWSGDGRAIARVGASAPRSSYRSGAYRGGYGRGFRVETVKEVHEARQAERQAEQPRGVEISRAGATLRLRFPYDPAMVEIARNLPGRRFDGATKAWLVPASNLDAVMAAFPGATLTGDLAAELDTQRKASEEAERARQAQLAVDLAAYETIRETLSRVPSMSIRMPESGG